MDNRVFDRIEKKYLISKAQKTELIKTLRKYMTKDDYYKSKIFNIYFDNDNYDLITQSIERPIFKEKLRARSYAKYNRVFLEIKTKIKGAENNVGYKRRIMIKKEDYQEFIKQKTDIIELAGRTIETKNDLQIAKEIKYLVEYFNLKPKIFISYNRSSFKDQHGLRITFDENLKYRNKNLDFKQSKSDKIYFKDNDKGVILEIKAHGVMPLWLVRKMSELKIYPQQFSKVGSVYQRIIKEQKNV